MIRHRLLSIPSKKTEEVSILSMFNQLKKGIKDAVKPAAQATGTADSQRETFTFPALPESLAQMQALPEAALVSPFQTAALSVCALCAYAADRHIGTEMLNWLKGPRPLTGHEISFLNDRFRDGHTYVPFSYFRGATPENDYTPTEPFTITIEAGPYSDANDGYKKLYIRSGGADNPREIVLRQKGGGQWLLWDQFLLVGIRTPKSADPWA